MGPRQSHGETVNLPQDPEDVNQKSTDNEGFSKRLTALCPPDVPVSGRRENTGSSADCQREMCSDSCFV